MIAPGMSFSTTIDAFRDCIRPLWKGSVMCGRRCLLPGVAGCVVTFVCLARLVNRLLERQYAGMFHGIFGIVSAATVMTVPWNSFATSPDDRIPESVLHGGRNRGGTSFGSYE